MLLFAGALLVTEAGGIVTDWSGDEEAWLSSGDILAAPPAVHDVLPQLTPAPPLSGACTTRKWV